MEILDADKVALRSLWELPRERQRVQLLLIQAIADSTDLSAKEIDSIISSIDDLLKKADVETTKKDSAL